MSSEARHRLNAEVATAKVIDGEAIVINVVNGRYYSLDDVAGAAWALLVAGATAAEAGTELSRRYEIEAERAATDVESLVADLLGERLLVRSTEPADAAELPDPAPERLSYSQPRLTVFTDMEELLAFDPPLPPSDRDVWESPQSVP